MRSIAGISACKPEALARRSSRAHAFYRSFSHFRMAKLLKEGRYLSVCPSPIVDSLLRHTPYYSPSRLFLLQLSTAPPPVFTCLATAFLLGCASILNLHRVHAHLSS
jgi:hypothetical protein